MGHACFDAHRCSFSAGAGGGLQYRSNSSSILSGQTKTRSTLQIKIDIHQCKENSFFFFIVIKLRGNIIPDSRVQLPFGRAGVWKWADFGSKWLHQYDQAVFESRINFIFVQWEEVETGDPSLLMLVGWVLVGILQLSQVLTNSTAE